MPDLSFLKKKELGLPIWAWAGIVAVLMYLLYRHYKNAGSGANTQNPVDTTSQATPADSGVAGDLGGGSGSSLGGAADTSGGLSELASALTNTPEQAYYQSLLDGAQGLLGSDLIGPDQPVNTTTTPTASTSGLEWDGQTFKSRSDFNAYLKSKGIGVAQFATRHPAAYSIYLALPAGSPKLKAPKSSVLGSAAKASGRVRSGISKVVKPGYQTFKKNVKLSAGESVHYTPGKGYYAAPKNAGASHPSATKKGLTSPTSRAPIPSRFYTYKTQVRLGQGQTLHFTKGRGYYAA